MRLAVPPALLLLLTAPAAALDPAAVVVVANRAVPESVPLAEHYLAARKVPAANLVVLDLPAGEEMTRADYDARLAGPLRQALAGRKDAVKVVLSVYGVPLKIGRTVPTAAEAAEWKEKYPRLAAGRTEVAALEKAKPADAAKLAAARRVVAGLQADEARLLHYGSEAGVDSELMLLWHAPYKLGGFLPNPLHRQFPAGKLDPRKPTLMTCRLDGPTPAVARRLVDDAVAVEAAGGLTGTAYIDARGLAYDPKKPGESGTGLEGYDESFREAAAHLKAAGLAVVLDDKPDLFPVNSCPDAALYAGWYALSDYRRCCTLNRGAVAWHLASYELTSLRTESKQWGRNLLLDGAAVTLGPVYEPYTVGFPKPAEFFGLLAAGELTVVECYARTQYLASWMGCLVGDPLYTPYGKAKPGRAAVPPSPRGAPNLFAPGGLSD